MSRLLLQRMVLLGVLLLNGVLAVTVDPTQLEVLFQLRSEMPVLETFFVNAWTDANLPQACSGMVSLWGLNACDNDGWVTRLNFIGLGTMPVTPFPPSIRNMSRLTHFGATNWFTGPLIPEIAEAPALQEINLNDFNLRGISGPFPEQWTQMPNLTSLALLLSDTFAGTLPQDTSQWTKLKTLSITYGRLTGSIPNSYAELPALKSITLRYVPITGSLPTAFAANTMVGTINIGFTQLNGSLPHDWRTAANLTHLLLGDNLLSGSIPSLFNPNFVSLFLSQNNLDGTIPQTFADSYPPHLQLMNNQFTGNLPWPTNWETSNLTNLGVSFNRDLQVAFPSFFWNMPNLKFFYADSTRIPNTLPSDVPVNCKMSWLRFSNSGLSGSLPDNFRYCSNLVDFWAANNSLTGSLPAEMGTWTNLQTIRLENNTLSGAFPPVWNSPNLMTINLANNRLTGSISETLLKMSSGLQTLVLNNNSIDICGDRNIDSTDFGSSLTACNVEGQDPSPCGCDGAWPAFCLAGSAIQVCPPLESPAALEPLSSPIEHSHPQEVSVPDSPTFVPSSSSPIMSPASEPIHVVPTSSPASSQPVHAPAHAPEIENPIGLPEPFSNGPSSSPSIIPNANVDVPTSGVSSNAKNASIILVCIYLLLVTLSV